MKLWCIIALAFSLAACHKSPDSPLSHDLSDQSTYRFIKSLINEKTGLVQSTENENFTTVYKNALAAMAFILKKEYPPAEKIFDFFNSKYDAVNFQGFTQFWNPDTGEPTGAVNYWEGDCSFLLIALNYYKEEKGSYGKYQNMASGLENWLAKRANEYHSVIIAEGLIDIFAALKPLENTLPPGMPDLLLKLHSAFLKKAAYHIVGDHIERAALTLGVLKGFDYIDLFRRQSVWKYNSKMINALSAFSSENFINTEISAQNLLAWKIWEDDLPGIDLSYLEAQLDSMHIPGIKNNQSEGIPYLTDHTDINMYSRPIIDPTCYMFFYFNNFNPMAPPFRKSIELNYDFIECEDIFSQTGQGMKEFHSDAIGDSTFQITESNSTESNELTYVANLHNSYKNPAISIRYSDDVGGNIIKVYIDDILQGELTTISTGGWNDFYWDKSIIAGITSKGSHRIKLNCSGGTYGVNLDVIKIFD